MKFAFLIDPLKTLNIAKDTSLLLMSEAFKRKHRTFIFTQDDITLQGDVVTIALQRILRRDGVNSLSFNVDSITKMKAEELDAIFIRKDPPFDQNYLSNTWILEFVSKKVLILNDPRGIRNTNEKICAHHFKKFIPETLITKNIADYKYFLKQHKNVILKPIDGFSGKNIFLVRQNDLNANAIFENITKDKKDYIIVQKYIRSATLGDKRILLLNGEPLGAILRLHSKGDHRNNFAAGGSAQKIKINKKDMEIVNALKPYLQKNGLYFVGIDIIGTFLTEINVTSPTCLQEMNKIYNKNLEKNVIDFVEESVKKFKRCA